MRTVKLGECCADCFDAINFSLSEIPPERHAAVKAAGDKISAKADLEGVASLHTGEREAFSHARCDGCGSTLAGSRWPLDGLTDRKDN